MLAKERIAKTRPLARPENIGVFGQIRVSVLGERLFRIEKSESGAFCDEATLAIWFRDQRRCGTARSSRTAKSSWRPRRSSLQSTRATCPPAKFCFGRHCREARQRGKTCSARSARWTPTASICACILRSIATIARISGWNRALPPEAARRCTTTAGRFCSVRTAFQSRARRRRPIYTCLRLNGTILPPFERSTRSAGARRFCRAGLWATGGAATGRIRNRTIST